MPGPIDIIRSKLEADNSKKLNPEEQKSLDALVADHFENALKSLGDDADVKPIIAKMKEGKYADALKDLRGWENTRLRAEGDKETYQGKAETLIAYLEEINSLETAKNKEINDIINETKKSLFEVFDDTQKSNFSKEIQELYSKLAKEGKVSAEAPKVTPVDKQPIKGNKVPVRSMTKREEKKTTPVQEKKDGKPAEKKKEAVVKDKVVPFDTQGPEYTQGDNITNTNIKPVEQKKEVVVKDKVVPFDTQGPEFTAGDNVSNTNIKPEVKKDVPAKNNATSSTEFTAGDNVENNNIKPVETKKEVVVKDKVTSFDRQSMDFTPGDNVVQADLSSKNEKIGQTGVDAKTEKKNAKERNSENYDAIDSYLEVQDKTGRHFLGGKVKRDFKDFLAQNDLSMRDVISDKGNEKLSDFLTVINNVDLKSAMNALLTDPTVLNAKIIEDEDGNKRTEALSNEEIRNRWKGAVAKNIYAPDGGTMGRREERMLVKLSHILTPIYLKQSDNLTKGEEAIMLILNTAKGESLLGKTTKEKKRALLKTSKGLTKEREGLKKIVDLSEADLKDMLSSKGSSLEKIMEGLLGDFNYDNNVKLEGKNADNGILTGGQVAGIYGMEKRKLALRYPEQAEEAMMANIVDLLLSEAEPREGNQTSRLEMGALKRIGFDREHVKTEKQFLQKCKDYPILLLVLQKKILAEGEEAPLLFERGTRYAKEVYERGIRAKDSKKPTTEMRKFSGAENIAKTIEKIDINTQRDVEKRIGDQYASMVTSLAEQIKTGKLADGTTIDKELLPALKKSLKILNNDKVAAENKKNLKINVLAAAVSEIEGNEGAGLAANLTSEKINDRLSNEKEGWINSINLSAGVFSPFDNMNNLAVGALLSFTGGKTWNQADEHKDNLKNGGEHRLLYAAGIGAGYDTSNGKFLAGPALAVGYEEQINANSMSKRLDARSATFLGAMVHGTLASWGADLYLRKDKEKGIIEQQGHLEKDFANIINSALNASGNDVSFEAVRKNIQKDFPKATKDVVYAATQNIISMIGPYKEVFNDPNNKNVDAKKAVVEAIARDYALLRRNEKMTDLNGNFSLSGIGGGIEFIAGVLPIPHAGLQFTKYKGLAFSEMQESLDRAHDLIKNGWGVDDDNRVSTTILERLPQLNALFNKEGEKNPVAYFHKDANDNLIIDKEVLGKKGFNFHVLPELKQFIKTNEQGGLIVPGTIPMMLSTLYRNNKYEQDFIIGSVGVKHTEAISSFDGFVGNPEKYEGAEITKSSIDAKLALTKEGQRIAKYLDILSVEKGDAGCINFSLKKAKALFGDNLKVTGIDTLKAPNQEEITYSVSKTSFLRLQENTYRDGRPSSLLLDVVPATKGFQLGYLHKIYAAPEKVTGEVTDIKAVMDSKYAKVSDKIKELSNTEKIGENNKKTMDMRYGKGKNDYIAFVKAMDAGKPEEAKKYAKNLLGFDVSNDDMRWLNAKLCMTAQTRDKDIAHIEGGEESIIKQAQELAKKLGITSADDLELISNIIKCDKCVNAESKKDMLTKIEKFPAYGDRNGDAYRLHSMLMNLDDIAQTRESYLMQHMKNEPLLKGELKALMAMRKESLSGVSNECLYHGKQLSDAIGMVFGYSSAAGVGVQEKFVGNPSVAEGKNGANTYTEKGITEGLKTYYLKNLLSKSADVIEAIIKTNPKYKELLDKIIAGNPKAYEKIKTKDRLNTAFVNELIKKDGKITASFGFAFYNECFNETLLMKDLKIVEDTPHVVPPTISEKMDEQVSDITISPDMGFYVNNYATTSKATVESKQYGIGVANRGKEVPSKKNQPATPGSLPGDGDIPSTPTTIPVETPGD